MVDELFLYDLEWAEEFCKKLIIENMGVEWFCTGKVKHGTSEIYSLMKEAGCVHIFMGIDSGNDKIINEMKKGFTVADVKESVRLIREAGICASGGLIIGSPSETKETWQDSVDLIKDLEIPLTWAGFITPYPGTKIYRDAVKSGLIPDEIEFNRAAWNTTALTVNFTQMPDAELIALKEDGLDDIHHHLIELSHDSLIGTVPFTKTASFMALRCKQCGEATVLCYSGVDMQMPIFSCRFCNFEQFIDPYSIPHVKQKIDIFADRVADLKGRIAVTPVGEWSKRLVAYINLKDKDMVGFLDGDKGRTTHNYLGYPVFHRTKDAVLEVDHVIVTAKQGLTTVIVQELKELGCDNILSFI